MQRVKTWYLLFIVLFCSLSLNAQKVSKEQRFFHEAEDLLFQGDREGAISKLEKSLKTKPNYVKAIRLLGRVHKENGDYEASKEAFRRYLKVRPAEAFKVDMEIGIIELEQENYDAAVASFVKAKENPNCPEKTKVRCDREIAKAEFRKKMKANPVPFNPQLLGGGVNSKYDEYLASLNAENNQLLFTRNIWSDSPLGNEDFYMSRSLEDASWSEASALGTAINTPGLEGALSISPDGKRMFFAAADRQNGYGNFDIYYSYKVNDSWVKPLNIGKPISTSAWESQPSISADGSELFFASKRKGNVGKIDIWYSQLVNNTWQDPINLAAVNTEGSEQCPVIHPDGQTLYFSSTGHLGMGKSDIFYVRRDAEGNWGEVKNLGYPINTQNHETGVFVDRKGEKAYYSSENGENGLDLYSFDLPKAAKPRYTTYVKGRVIDAITKLPLVADLEIINLESNKVLHKIDSNSDGTFLLTLPTGQQYAYSAEKNTYLFHSENFDLRNNANAGVYNLTIELHPIEKEESIILKNIFFETNSFVLKNISDPEIQKLYELLKANTSMEIELVGHTDDIGEDTYNLALSEKRANAVKEKLLEKGIAANRIRAKGKGEEQPIVTNDSDENRAQNRRVEMRIVNR